MSISEVRVMIGVGVRLNIQVRLAGKFYGERS